MRFSLFSDILFPSLLLLLVSPDLRAQQLPLKSYATVDGLAHNQVNRVVRDSHGFLWFCTAGGLSRFDGYQFVNFGTELGLPHASVNDLLETRAGEYWVATDGGLVRFDPKGKPGRGTTSAPMFTTIVPAGADRRAQAIDVLLEDRQGTIWVGTKAGLYRLERSAGRRSLQPIDVAMPHDFPEQRIIADLLEDKNGSLWIASPSGLYRRWPDGSAARYTKRDGLPGDYVHDLLEDPEGHLWAATLLDGFFRFRADASPRAPVIEAQSTYSEHDPYGLPTSWVNQLFVSSDHRFWVATARGLVEFFPAQNEKHRFHGYTARNGLSDFEITALNEDRDGNLWLGTNTSGVMKMARGGLSTYSKQDGIETLNTLFEDPAGHLCFRGSVIGEDQTSVHSQFGCFDGQRFDWFKPASVAEFGWVNERIALRARNGEWWLGTGSGVYRFPPTENFVQLKSARPLAVYTMKDGLANLQTFRLFEDSQGSIWISTAGSPSGLARWDARDQRIHNLSGAVGLPSLNDDLARCFAEDAYGNVWIGFVNGLVRYAHNRFTYFTAANGLPAGAINNIYQDRSHRLWLASAGSGLVRVDNVDAVRPKFATYTTAQGLSSNNIEVVVEDVFGRIYVGGGRGLDRLDPATGRIKHFTTADGLASGSFRDAFRDRNGALWFGLSGLSRLAPVLEGNQAPPAVLITGLRISGIPHRISAVGESELSLADFAPNQNQVEIDFVGLGFGTGDMLRYQYKLDGTNARWSSLNEQRSVTYASLGAGHYKFLVRAINADGIMSEHPASIAFTILHPIWLRWWFLTLLSLALTSIVYALYRRRVNGLLAMANMRTRIATDLHDDIGANLTRIALLSEVVKHARHAEAEDDDDTPLASITRIARESVGSMSDIVWAINPKRETLLDLIRRMRQHADEIFTLRNIGLRFNAPAPSENLKLSMDVRRDLLLIFKEAVNNAARHSACSNVEIDLCVEDSRFVMVVADDGVGLDPSVQSEGQGLASMQRRAQRLSGTLEIKSAVGMGTKIRLEMPI